MTTHQLLTADDATDLVAVDSTITLTADQASRTMTGIVVPYNVHGMTSAGRVRVRAGAIELPTDLSRIKLLTHHSDVAPPPEAIGVAINAQDTAEGLVLTFKIANTAAGDEALVLAAEHVKDSFSVELSRTQVHRDEVLAGYLNAVAHVPVPAWSGARITDIAASHHPEGTTMTPEQIARLAELRAKDTLTQEEASELAQLAAAETAAADAGEQADPPAGDQAPAAPAAGAAPPAGEPAAPEVTAGLARVPAGLAATHAPNAGGGSSLLASAHGVFSVMARTFNGERSAELTAALEDIAYSSSPFANQPEYVGELWNGADYERKFTELLTQDPLTSLKVTGWRWLEEPDVADWAGDKADVPSNEVSWEEVPYTANRLAGAHDIAREWWDFGETAAIEAFYRVQAKNYKKRTDSKALAGILAAATGTTTVEGNILRAAAVAANEVNTLTDGQDATAIVVNSTDWLGLLDVTNFDVPAYLRDVLGIEPGNFRRSANVPAGQVVALARPAMRWRELPGVPIRVTAEHIAKGGKDSGLFGYWLTQLDNPLGIRRVTFTPPAGA